MSEQALPFVIPDSIEPVIGYKAFSINASGLLRSPSYPMVWTPRLRAEATCLAHRYENRWVAKRIDRTHSFSSGSAPVPWGMFVATTSEAAQVPVKPLLDPPPGKEWVLERVMVKDESPPSESCNCGIHLADTPVFAASYGEIIARVAGWGKTIKHARGFRVQYAYPIKVWFPNEHLLDFLDASYEVEAESYEGSELESCFRMARERGPIAAAFAIPPAMSAPSKLSSKTMFRKDPEAVLIVLLAILCMLTSIAMFFDFGAPFVATYGAAVLLFIFMRIWRILHGR